MRYLVIGDIHGYAELFDAVLEMADLQADDVIITLGDYIDRGPDSSGVLDRLIKLKQTHQLIPLIGNHDVMMLDARWMPSEMGGWLSVGGYETIQSYDASASYPYDLSQVPDAHWRFLNECVRYHEMETHFFVHANVFYDIPLDEQPDMMLLWEHLRDPIPHCSGKIMVCGHTKQRSGRPWNLGHTLCLDTWVYGNGWLTCLDLLSGKYWQANRHGERREDYLDEPEEEMA